ncbi:MAG: MBL fold metallo-hydrolase, partial [Acaryochloridaceae cyanobacterium RL_2_7]|nr:MBL fold metallo-hydrolase [Acaryochloridaceae cyanobacterium RL_2_7]
MLDCGLFDPFELLIDLQKLENKDHKTLDGVICSHAHLDHVHSLLKVHETYPTVRRFCKSSHCYAFRVSLVTSRVQSLNTGAHSSAVRSPYPIDEQLSIELLPAGHLPGAAASLIEYTANKASQEVSTILYSGDFCL